MIFDGYNETGVISGGRTVVFRPLIRESRRDLLEFVRGLPADYRLPFIRSIAQKRLVAPVGVLTEEDCMVVLGRDRVAAEIEDVYNLKHGVRVALFFPHLQTVSCASCRAYWYDPLEGRTVRRGGEPIRRTEEPLLCDEGMCPVGHWKNQRRLSPKNLAAFQHWKMCKKAGSFPDDEIVRRNAMVIEGVLRGSGSLGRDGGVGGDAGELVRAGAAGRAGAGGKRAGAGGNPGRRSGRTAGR